jgi:hypothetical protein
VQLSTCAGASANEIIQPDRGAEALNLNFFSSKRNAPTLIVGAFNYSNFIGFNP